MSARSMAWAAVALAALLGSPVKAENVGVGLGRAFRAQATDAAADGNPVLIMDGQMALLIMHAASAYARMAPILCMSVDSHTSC